MAKALVRVNGKELISYSMDLLAPTFIDRLIFAVDHHERQIREWVESVSLPYDVVFSNQEQPGFLNAVECAFSASDKNTILLLHTDVIRLGMQLQGALEFHQSLGIPATVVTTKTDRLYHHWQVSFDLERRRVLGFTIRDQSYRRAPNARGTVLTGTIILDRTALSYADRETSIDFAGLVQPLVDANELGIYIDETHALFDVGTPEEFKEAEEYFKGLKRV